MCWLICLLCAFTSDWVKINLYQQPCKKGVRLRLYTLPELILTSIIKHQTHLLPPWAEPPARQLEMLSPYLFAKIKVVTVCACLVPQGHAVNSPDGRDALTPWLNVSDMEGPAFSRKWPHSRWILYVASAWFKKKRPNQCPFFFFFRISSEISSRW